MISVSLRWHRPWGRTTCFFEMIERSKNYINILDSETKMVRGRNSDGTWKDVKDVSISGWTQGADGDRENYFRNIILFVPHDVHGLANFMGGNSQLERYLDYFLSIIFIM